METCQIEIYGQLNATILHMTHYYIRQLCLQESSLFKIKLFKPMFEFDWNVYILGLKRKTGKELLAYDENVIVILNGSTYMPPIDIIKWIDNEYGIETSRPQYLFESICEDGYSEEIRLLLIENDIVYFDVEINGKLMGRLVILLYSKLTPKTCFNFKCLCTGEYESNYNSESNIKLNYKNTKIHRIVPNGWIQAGNLLTNITNVTKNTSIFNVDDEKVREFNKMPTNNHKMYKNCDVDNGPTTHTFKKASDEISLFEDECFAIKNNKRGTIGMANGGRNTNGSQFYITLDECTNLDKKYVAFGRIIEGWGVLDIIENVPTIHGIPSHDIKLSQSGIISQ